MRHIIKAVTKTADIADDSFLSSSHLLHLQCTRCLKSILSRKICIQIKNFYQHVKLIVKCSVIPNATLLFR